MSYFPISVVLQVVQMVLNSWIVELDCLNQKVSPVSIHQNYHQAMAVSMVLTWMNLPFPLQSKAFSSSCLWSIQDGPVLTNKTEKQEDESALLWSGEGRFVQKDSTMDTASAWWQFWWIDIGETFWFKQSSSTIKLSRTIYSTNKPLTPRFITFWSN